MISIVFMKTVDRLITSLFFVILSIQSFGQISPLPEVGSTWSQASFGMFGLESLDPYLYSAEEIVLIDEIPYTKIGEGYFREEGDIWFCRTETDSIDHLLYDFNLEEGDTLFLSNPFILGWGDFSIAEFAVVQSTEMVEMENGSVRKRQNFISYSVLEDGEFLAEEESVIAGIGSLENLFYFGFLGEQLDWEVNQLVCFHSDNNQLIYENPVEGYWGVDSEPVIYENCDWYVGISELNELSGISVFPNPVMDKLNLDFSGSNQNEALVTISNLQGKTILKKKIFNSDPILSLGHLDSGIYYLTLDNNKFKKHTKKIVKL